MTSQGGNGGLDGFDDALVSGWEDAMTEVIENEYSERASERTPVVGGYVDVSSTTRNGGAGDNDAPPAIIESATVDSTPLLRLESSESHKSKKKKLVEAEEKSAEGGENAWFDLADSSSSKGSQGSYADQVPALSGSGSALEPFDVTNREPKESRLKVEVAPSPSKAAPSSPAFNSVMEVPTDEASSVSSGHKSAKSVTKHTTDAVHGGDDPILEMEDTMEDILGRNETRNVDAAHGGAASTLEKKETLEDILGPDARNSAAPSPKDSVGSKSQEFDEKDTLEDIIDSNGTNHMTLGDQGPLNANRASEVSDKPGDDVDDIQDSKPNDFTSSSHQPLLLADFEGHVVVENGVATGSQGHMVNNFILSDSQGARNSSEIESSAKHMYELRESQVPPMDDGPKDDNLNRIVQSLGNHQQAQTRSDRSEPGRLLSGPKASGAPDDSDCGNSPQETPQSLEEQFSEMSGEDSSWDDEKLHPGSPGSDVLNPSMSNNTSFSQSKGPTGVDSSFSNQGDTFSPTSQSDSLFSNNTSFSHHPSASYGETTHTMSHDESLTTAGPSVLSGYTSYTGYTGYTGYSTNTGYTGFTNQSEYTEVTETEPSVTGHTRNSVFKSPAAQGSSAGTGFFTARTDRNDTGHSRATFNESIPETSLEEGSQSGRSGYVSRAQIEEHTDEYSGHAPAESKQPDLKESLMARTRSRADPSAVSPTAASTDTERPTMIRIGEEQDERFIVNTALARKRVSVVQLLIIGLVSILVSFFGSIWIQSSCHYVSADVYVGESKETFNLHFGLWKFSPIGSAFQGYTYCDRYDEEYSAEPPLVPRFAALFASFAGAYAVMVLWYYLIFGRGTRLAWDAAVNFAAFAGVSHGASLLIFITPPCDETECKLGPAGAGAIAACIVNLTLAFEMYYNSPIKSWMDDIPNCPSSEQPRRMMQTFELVDFQEGASAYCKRLISAPSGEIPTLNQIQRKNEDPLGEAMFGRDLAHGVYAPPNIV